MEIWSLFHIVTEVMTWELCVCVKDVWNGNGWRLKFWGWDNCWWGVSWSWMSLNAWCAHVIEVEWFTWDTKSGLISVFLPQRQECRTNTAGCKAAGPFKMKFNQSPTSLILVRLGSDWCRGAFRWRWCVWQVAQCWFCDDCISFAVWSASSFR